jgi:hypothetical protein
MNTWLKRLSYRAMRPLCPIAAQGFPSNSICGFCRSTKLNHQNITRWEAHGLSYSGCHCNIRTKPIKEAADKGLCKLNNTKWKLECIKADTHLLFIRRWWRSLCLPTPTAPEVTSITSLPSDISSFTCTATTSQDITIEASTLLDLISAPMRSRAFIPWV